MLDVVVNEKTDFYAYRNWFKQIQGVKSVCLFPMREHRNAVITIAIPTYKRVDLLQETLESALNQIGFDDYNIIVVDNNPERYDETEVFMERYRESRIAYYKNIQNLYMGGNWNRCVELVNTDWFVLLHDDDTISPIFMREIVKATNKYPKAAVIQTEKVSDVKLLADSDCGENLYKRRGKLDFYKGTRVSGNPTGVAYRKECVVTLGGFPYDIYQGYAYWFHVKCVQAYPYYTIMAPLTFYRMSTQNASAHGELHETWICYEYWLLRNMMKKNWVPHFIYEPYIQQHARNQEEGLRAVWGSNFNFPDKYIKRIDYPSWRFRLTTKYLRVYARLLNLIQI